MSGSSDSIIKECSAVWSRLFDHKPFLQGEISFFVKEFEEKRGDREVENLFKILEKTTEIRDSQVPKLQQNAIKNLPVFKNILDEANESCDQVLEARSLYNLDVVLKSSCETLENQNEQFEKELKSKYKTVDESFVEKEKLLREYYKELSDKLHKSLNI